MLVSKTSKAYISVRFSSPRVIATETGNKENLKGYYLGDGVTALMRDGKEYENIFPVWTGIAFRVLLLLQIIEICLYWDGKVIVMEMLFQE